MLAEKTTGTDEKEEAYCKLTSALGKGWMPDLMKRTGLSMTGLKKFLKRRNTDHELWKHVTERLQEEGARREALREESERNKETLARLVA